jgi:CheY-like chemotaxis protein
MKKMAALFLFIASGIGSTLADSVQQPLYIQQSSNKEISTGSQQTLKTAQQTDDTLAEGTKFKDKDTKQQLDFVQTWYDHSLGFVVGFGGFVITVGTLLAGVITWMGYRSYHEMLQRIEGDVRKRADQHIDEAISKFDERLEGEIDQHAKIFQDIHDRRSEKYKKLMVSIFRSIVSSSQAIRYTWVEQHFPHFSHLNGLRFLWVDDDPIGIVLFTTLLEYYGAKVDVVTSSKEGVSSLSRSMYDVIITNLNRFPNEERGAGYRFLQKLRGDGISYPILIFTKKKHLGEYSPPLPTTEIAVNEEQFFTHLNSIVSTIKTHAP